MERQSLHADIVAHLLASPRTNPHPEARAYSATSARGVENPAGKALFGSSFDVHEQQIFIVVGVPGSGTIHSAIHS